MGEKRLEQLKKRLRNSMNGQNLNLALSFALISILIWFIAILVIWGNTTRHLGPLLSSWGLLSLSFCFLAGSCLLNYLNIHNFRLFIFQTFLLAFQLFFLPALIGYFAYSHSVMKYMYFTEYIKWFNGVNPSYFWAHTWPLAFYLHYFIIQLIGWANKWFYVMIFSLLVEILYGLIIFAISRELKLEINDQFAMVWLFYLFNWVNQDYVNSQSIGYLLFLIGLFALFKFDTDLSKIIITIVVSALLMITHLFSFLAFFLTVFSYFSVKALKSKILMLIGLLILLLTVIITLIALLFFSLNNSEGILQRILTEVTVLLQGDRFFSTLMSNLFNRLNGSFDHIIVVTVRIIWSSSLFLMVLLSGYWFLSRGLQGGFNKLPEYLEDNKTAFFLLLAILANIIVPTILTAYGGELFIRIFFFTMPLGLFAIVKTFNKKQVRLLVVTILLIGPSVHLLAHYGDETTDAVTLAEINAVEFLFDDTAKNRKRYILGLYDSDYSPNENVKIFSFNQISLDSERGLLLPLPPITWEQYVVFSDLHLLTAERFETDPNVTHRSKTLKETVMMSKFYALAFNNSQYEIFRLKNPLMGSSQVESFETILNQVFNLSQIPGQDSGLTYIPHLPIRIDGNLDFATRAALNNWSGDGSISNPYLIKNLNISGSPVINLILIQNTDVYFHITKSILTRGKNAVYLDNVTNGLISRNLILNNTNGITLESAENNIILANNISENAMRGIYLISSNNCSILGNYISSNSIRGVALISSNNCVVSGNYVLNNSENGFFLDFSRNINISANLVFNNYHSGLAFRSSRFNHIANNFIFNNSRQGISLDYSRYNSLINNTVMNNSLEGISLSVSNDTEISGNTLYNNSNGLSIASSGNNVVKENSIIFNKRHGVLLSLSQYNFITRNTFYLNQNSSLIFMGESSANNSVTLNNFIRNNQKEIYSVSQATDKGKSNSFEMNFWDEFIFPDNDSDGFVDTSYYIERSKSNFDDHPLVQPFTSSAVHFLSRPVLISNPTGIMDQNSLIRWKAPLDSHNHTIAYSFYYSADWGTIWTELESEIYTTSYFLNTTTFNDSEIMVGVIATCSNGLSASYSSWDTIIINPYTPQSSQQPMNWPWVVIIVSIITIVSIWRYFLN